MKLQCQRGTSEFPYCVYIEDSVVGNTEIHQWCVVNFGKEYATTRYRNFLTYWFFRDEQDRTLFILRWS
jgi:hypothetical protein